MANHRAAHKCVALSRFTWNNMAKQKEPSRKVGRPSLYTVELGEQICHRIAQGETLQTICLDSELPDRITVWRWLDKHPDFATLYARAREAQGDVMDEMILSTADACTSETAAADRVKIAAYQWRAERLKPKAYGTKVTSEITGKDGGPIETADMPPRDLTQRAVFLVAKAAKAGK